MTLSKLITLDYDDEMRSTRRLLERVPLDEAHRNYKPHEKSMPLDRLATHVAEIPAWPKVALDTEVLEMQPGFQPHIAGSTAELLEIFDKNVEAGRARLATATDEEMQKTWSFKFGDVIAFSDVRTKVIRSCINHMVHHRAQLGVYLRLNAIPVPGMYGPTADEQPAARSANG